VAEFSGTATKQTEPDQKITPVYKECTDSRGRTVDVTVKATYTFTPAAPTAEANVHLVGEITLSITNGSGSQVCHVLIKSQENNGVTYHNREDAKGKYVEVTTHTNNVTTETAGGVLNCGVGNGHHEGGSYTGETIMRGTVGGVPTNIWVE
jgi:hypothetical protein